MILQQFAPRSEITLLNCKTQITFHFDVREFIVCTLYGSGVAEACYSRTL